MYVYCLSLCKVKAISTHFLVENRTGLSDIISGIEWHPKSASCRPSCESARYGCLVDKYGNQVLPELLFQTEKPKKTSLLKLCFKEAAVAWKLTCCRLHLLHLQFLWFYGNPSEKDLWLLHELMRGTLTRIYKKLHVCSIVIFVCFCDCVFT